MKKILACVGLIGGLAATALLETPASAQSKKEAAGTVKILENAKGRFYFQIRNAEGKFLCQSIPSGYETAKEAEAALEEVKKIVTTVKPVSEKAPAPKDGKKKAG